MYLLYGFGTVSGCGQDPSGQAVSKQEEKVRNRTSTELLKGFLLRIRTRETLGQVMRSVPSEVIPAHEASDAASHLRNGNGLILLDPELAMCSPQWLDTEVSTATSFYFAHFPLK